MLKKVGQQDRERCEEGSESDSIESIYKKLSTPKVSSNLQIQAAIETNTICEGDKYSFNAMMISNRIKNIYKKLSTPKISSDLNLKHIT